MAGKEYYVPDAYRSTGKRAGTAGRAGKAAKKPRAQAEDAMMDLSHPYFEQALADFKRLEGIEAAATLTRSERRVFEVRVLTGRIVVRLDARVVQEAERKSKAEEKYRGVQGWEDILELVKTAAAP